MAAPGAGGGASCAQEAGFFAEHRAFAARLGELAGSAGAPPSALDGHVEFLSGVVRPGARWVGLARAASM